MKKRKIIVCGGSKGIGAACIRDLLEKQFELVCISRTEGEISSFIKSGEVRFYACNLANKEERLDVISKVITNNDYWGLVNNASGPATGSIVNSNTEDYTTAFETHLFASNDWTQALYENFKKNGEGRIVNIISVTAKVPLENMAVSNTLRGAILNWSKTLSKEYGKLNVNVNNVLPGYTETGRLLEVISSASDKKKISTDEYKKSLIDQIPLNRFGQPSEIAKVVSFLMSSDASYINGASIPVDGGWTVCP